MAARNTELAKDAGRLREGLQRDKRRCDRGAGRLKSCSVEVASVRAEPREDAEQVTQLLEGEPVWVLEEREGWARIETAYAYPGWVRAEAVGRPAVEDPWPAAAGEDVLAEARAYLGAPYERGGLSRRGIDCSGLVHMAFRRVGILVPRDSWEQEEAGAPVAEAELEPGDLLCYPGHVAFWLGERRILHASGRAGVEAVVEEQEPSDLASKRCSGRRFGRKSGSLSPPI
jgi:cell wall-associated NlpC family hydrolase